MSKNKSTEGVGKKIVEALKMQSDIEITPAQSIINDEIVETPVAEDVVTEEIIAEDENFEQETYTEENLGLEEESDSDNNEDLSFDRINTAFEESLKPYISQDIDDLEIPTNVAILKQLITKLPVGVTKQTGAMIIKQTMEALGISMKGVLQEAQQTQEQLSNSSKDCQASIVEHKKQIDLLEQQIQKQQKQYIALNDIISLFVQTSI